ncbi:MAG: helix-turn-helix domain-containing protein [Burkholderiales bacterium]|nr:helix-turn-helix domain-containing protein [Burkholderiales bacterium]
MMRAAPRIGRPTKYHPDLARRAELLCRRGLTDVELANFFGVAKSTLNLWKLRHPEFSDSLKRGKDYADALIVEALYRRACGYSHPAVKIVLDARSRTVLRVPYTKHYPPDTTACIFWLTNRQPGKWSNRVRHDVGDPTGGPARSNILAGS